MEKGALVRAALRKALPYAAGALAAGAAGAGGYAVGTGEVKEKQTQAFRQGVRRAIRGVGQRVRKDMAVRDRALRSFYVQNRHLSRMNQALRNRLGQALATARKEG